MKESLIILRNVGRNLLKNRKLNDAVSFESHQVKFKLNKETGTPKEVKTKTPLEVHSTIEEMMVVANSTVAERLYTIFPLTAFLRRHAAPDERKTTKLNNLFLELGMSSNINLNTTPLSDCLKQAIALAKGDLTKISLIRTSAVKIMSEAKYFCTGSLRDTNTNERMNHFGLGIGMYTHFTSTFKIWFRNRKNEKCSKIVCHYKIVIIR